MAQDMKRVGAEVSAGDRPLTALAVVVGVAVLREGSEVVLFLLASPAPAARRTRPCWRAARWAWRRARRFRRLMYYGLLAIPPGKLFSVTAWLITLLAAGMAAQAVLFLQQAGYLQFLTRRCGTRRGCCRRTASFGRLLHTLVGYSDAPNGLQLMAYLATIAGVTGADAVGAGAASARKRDSRRPA